MKKLLLLLLLLYIPSIGFAQELGYETLLKNHIINVWIEPSLVTEEGCIIENTVNELSLYDADSNFLQTYAFPVERIIKGDLDNDNKDEVILIIFQQGGGAGGNIGGYEYYIIYSNDESIVELYLRGDNIINPPNNNYMYFSCNKIENNLMYGSLNICTYDGGNKYDDVWESITAKGKLMNGKIMIID